MKGIGDSQGSGCRSSNGKRSPMQVCGLPGHVIRSGREASRTSSLRASRSDASRRTGRESVPCMRPSRRRAARRFRSADDGAPLTNIGIGLLSRHFRRPRVRATSAPRQKARPIRQSSAIVRCNTVEGVHVLPLHILPASCPHGPRDCRRHRGRNRRPAIRCPSATGRCPRCRFRPRATRNPVDCVCERSKPRRQKIFFPVIFPVLRETRRPGNRTDGGRPHRLPICAAHTRNPYTTGQPPHPAVCIRTPQPPDSRPADPATSGFATCGPRSVSKVLIPDTALTTRPCACTLPPAAPIWSA
jgi:hypothetical protein